MIASSKGRSTGNLLTLWTDSWSSCPRCYSEIFSVALDIAKAFDWVWHKFLLSKLPSFGLYPSLCSFISTLPSGHSISAMIDSHCSFSKLIISGVPQSSVLSPTLFLLFINDLSITICPIHSYADDFTLHYSTSFDRRSTLQDSVDSRLEVAERLTSDLAIFFHWGTSNLVSFNAPKPNFFIYLLDTTSQTSIPYSLTTHSYHLLQHYS